MAWLILILYQSYLTPFSNQFKGSNVSLLGSILCIHLWHIKYGLSGCINLHVSYVQNYDNNFCTFPKRSIFGSYAHINQQILLIEVYTVISLVWVLFLSASILKFEILFLVHLDNQIQKWCLSVDQLVILIIFENSYRLN